jgi:hypothetical protein
MSSTQLLEQTRASLERIQRFDASTLARIEELGRQLSFEDAVEPAQRVIDLFKRVPESILSSLVDSQLNTIKGRADAEYNRFSEVMAFSASQNNAAQARSNLIQQIKGAYDTSFPELWQFIAFGIANNTDSASLESRARAVLQDIEDRATALTDELATKESKAEDVLKHIQAVAAEQGVSQQAEFFKRRADDHEKQATWWRNATGVSIAVTILFAVFSALAFKFSWLRADNQFDALEFVTGKILVFITLAGLIALCAKNFLAHQHNVVLNRHRQTALQTYRVLVDAGTTSGSQDIILAYASSCIFGSQDTGFAKEGAEGGMNKSVLELMTKSTAAGTAH